MFRCSVSVSLLLLGSLAAAGEPQAIPPSDQVTDAQALVGPFARVEDYCASLATRKVTLSDEGPRTLACGAPPRQAGDDGDERAPSCQSPEFPALPDGVFREARLFEVHVPGADEGSCLLAWRSTAGWWVHESALRPEAYNSHHYDFIVAARPHATADGHGVVARVRLRATGITRDKELNRVATCSDELTLYGVGPSGPPSAISVNVGDLEDCDATLYENKNTPPSRWDEYLLDQLLPDGKLRLKRVGRHRTKKAPAVFDQPLRFL
jgi:hypothetical protein